MGFTHLWLTGVLEQASGTAYPGRPADDPDILKGIAGSPYAIRDYFDVCPDYAPDPDRRLDEFKALLERCREPRLKVIIDFVPNHVARSYAPMSVPTCHSARATTAGCFSPGQPFLLSADSDHPGGGPPLRCRPPACPVATGCSRRRPIIRPGHRQQRGFLDSRRSTIGMKR
jgi:hypothetical protein